MTVWQVQPEHWQPGVRIQISISISPQSCPPGIHLAHCPYPDQDYGSSPQLVDVVIPTASEFHGMQGSQLPLPHLAPHYLAFSVNTHVPKVYCMWCFVAYLWVVVNFAVVWVSWGINGSDAMLLLVQWPPKLLQYLTLIWCMKHTTNTHGNFTSLWWEQTKYKPLATNGSLGHVIWLSGGGDMAILNQ